MLLDSMYAVEERGIDGDWENSVLSQKEGQIAVY